MSGNRRRDQLLPNFSFGDAIGNHVQALRDIFRSDGAPSEIFAAMRHPKVRALAHDYSRYLPLNVPGNTCFFHFSIGSSLSEFFGRLKVTKVLIYHNITPERYLKGVNRRAEFECRRGREELRRLADRVDFALADSEFNRQELQELGYRRTEVLPIIVDLAAYRAPGRGAVAKRFGGGEWTNILHVSRFVPNKKIEDVIKSFAVFRKIRPKSRLMLVGTDVSFENYSGALRELAANLKADDVHFCGHVSFEDLCAYYDIADLYLHMSEHEGFCVPLLEAMHFEVPIVAFAAAAVPETLGEGGLLVKEKRFDEIAELMDYVLSSEDLRRKLAAAGRERLQDFAPARIADRLRDIISRHSL